MNFESDAFISYAHLDNVELIEGRKGWVANLHRALEIRVGQLLGKQPQIWRDPELQGNDLFADTLIERLQRVATLVSVVSPRYVKSDWARKELSEFWKAAEKQGGVRFQEKGRIFKVLKTPVPLEMQSAELRSVLGYEFFKIDPETGRVRELDEVFGPEAQREFWIRLDDLAHDICGVLELMEVPAEAAPSDTAEEKKPVYVAETTRDLGEQREAIKRDLEQHGHPVLPTRPLPLFKPDLVEAVREDLARSAMSIHLVGKSYSLVPEGGIESLVEIQNEIAIERGEQGAFSRLVWIPHGLQIEDERQKKVIEQLRMDPRLQKGADLMETFLEDLKTVYQERLKRVREPVKETSIPAAAGDDHVQIVLIYDQRDSGAAALWGDFLFEQRFEVMHPVFEGDEAEVREYHEQNLCVCDGALIFYGAANEMWLRRKLRELQKSAGYGRTKPMPVTAISLLAPRTAEKERFRTHEAMVIPQLDGFSPEPLRPFISRLTGR